MRAAARRVWRRVDPTRRLVEPLLLATAVGAVGAAMANALAAGLAASVIALLSVRVAYDHRGVGTRYVPQFGPWPFGEGGRAPQWYSNQLAGAALFFLAVAILLVALRDALPG
jgi:hypothetical protein